MRLLQVAALLGICISASALDPVAVERADGDGKAYDVSYQDRQRIPSRADDAVVHAQVGNPNDEADRHRRQHLQAKKGKEDQHDAEPERVYPVLPPTKRPKGNGTNGKKLAHPSKPEPKPKGNGTGHGNNQKPSNGKGQGSPPKFPGTSWTKKPSPTSKPKSPMNGHHPGSGNSGNLGNPHPSMNAHPDESHPGQDQHPGNGHGNTPGISHAGGAPPAHSTYHPVPEKGNPHDVGTPPAHYTSYHAPGGEPAHTTYHPGAPNHKKPAKGKGGHPTEPIETQHAFAPKPAMPPQMNGANSQKHAAPVALQGIAPVHDEDSGAADNSTQTAEAPAATTVRFNVRPVAGSSCPATVTTTVTLAPGTTTSKLDMSAFPLKNLKLIKEFSHRNAHDHHQHHHNFKDFSKLFFKFFIFELHAHHQRASHLHDNGATLSLHGHECDMSLREWLSVFDGWELRVGVY